MMSAMQKAAWTEFLLSVLTLVMATLLIPWFGPGARAAFGLLGLLPLSGLFLLRRGQRVLIDERDREIEQRSMRIGINSAWMLTFTTLILVTMWSNIWQQGLIATSLLEWLIWVQFALCYGLKGLAAVVLYGKPSHAA